MDLLSKAQKKFSVFKDDQIVAAVALANRVHRHQYLYGASSNKIPFLNHCIEIGMLLAEMGGNATLIAAGILHDTTRYHDLSHEQLVASFGIHVAHLVEEVAKLSYMCKLIRHYNQPSSTYNNELCTMLMAMVDVRAVIIKLADRLDKMNRVEFLLPMERRSKFIKQTLDVIAPLAGRLGLDVWKGRLQDLCFKNLEREEYDELVSKFSETTLESAVSELMQQLNAMGLAYRSLSSRRKSLYGIHNKMKR
ncbi:(p)ppGpp synthetase [Corchorus olitorius]|uniref:(P)ppGpp synthetase n=1 Tax=Corchorus olitorius TaxID=93759 RepID=A0A1R3K274_9ROSI|nr:(p)ppGpp synthetase [Corchorus olitorius]